MSEIFQVTARKWRPMRFDDVVGQEHITRTLKNALREDRLAHGYLFTGQRGCGKTTVARILAKAINCPNRAENDFEPCNKCDSCLSITDGRSMDVSEIDGASNNSVDDVRSLRDNVKYPPVQGEYKVVIIDEVHMLSNQAFNALLKTLEEPPKHLVFVFATTEVQKVIPTILSRTQRYDFRRIQLEEIAGQLRKIADADGITIEDDALFIIAKKADGSMRDGQSIFDQVVAYCGMTVETSRVREALNLIDADFFFEVTDAISERAPAKAFELSEQIVSRGYDSEEFVAGLLEHFRNILTVLVSKNAKLIEVSKNHQDRYLKVAHGFSEGDIIRLVRLAQSALERFKTSIQPRIVLEMMLVEMMMMERAVEIASLLDQLRSLNRDPGPAISDQGNAVPATASKAPSRMVTEAPRAAVKESAAARPAPAPRNADPVSRISTPKVAPVESNSVIFSEPERIGAEWSRFMDFLTNKSKPIMSVANEMVYCGMRRNTVYIGITGKAAPDMLMRFKDLMTSALREFYGFTALTFEIGDPGAMRAKSGMPVVQSEDTTGDDPAMRSLLNSGNMEPSSRVIDDDNVRTGNGSTKASTSKQSREDRTPIENALISVLGAEEV